MHREKRIGGALMLWMAIDIKGQLLVGQCQDVAERTESRILYPKEQIEVVLL